MRRMLLSSSIVLSLLLLPGSTRSTAQKIPDSETETAKKVPPHLVKIVVKDTSEERVDAQRIFIDPVTGRPRQPTPAELEALRAAVRSPRVVRELHFSGGGVIQEMELGVFEDYVIATLDKDGKVTMRCVRHGIDHDATGPAVPAVKKTAAEVK